MAIETKHTPHSRPSGTIIPETMRAVASDRSGGPEVLTVHTLPVPPIEKREVLIELDTAGVGVWDAEMRSGWRPADVQTFRWFSALTVPAE